MSEKRFKIIHLGNPYDFVVKDFQTNRTYGTSEDDKNSLEYLLNRLDFEIEVKQKYIEKLQDLCGESDGENAKLRIENKKLKAKLKEKEEDEQLYANEIVELRETNKQWLEFKELGGDY